MEVYTLLRDNLYPLLTSHQTAEVFEMLAIWRNAVRFCDLVRASVDNTHLKEALHVIAVCEPHKTQQPSWMHWKYWK